MEAWITADKKINAAVKLASRELFKALSNPAVKSKADVVAIMNALSREYGEIAAASAFQALKNSREAMELWDVLPRPVLASAVPREQVAKATAWALHAPVRGGLRPSPSVIKERLSGSLTRFIQEPAHQTVIESARAAGTRWARVPTADACAFCLMLASRGAVYASKETASGAGRTKRNRGKRAAGEEFHDDCRCRVIESFTDADLPQVVHDLHDEWNERYGNPQGMSFANLPDYRQYIRENAHERRQKGLPPFIEVKPDRERFKFTDKNLEHVWVGEPPIKTRKGVIYKGGHVSGAARRGKTEYPKDWSPEITRQAVEYVLSNPNYSFNKDDEIYFQGSFKNVVIEVRYRVDQSPKRNPDGTKVNFNSAYPIGSTDESVVLNSKTEPVVSRILKRPHGEYARKWI